MKGSRKCILKLVESADFIKKINSLLKPTGAELSIYDNWLPKSMSLNKEAELKDFLKYNFSKRAGQNIHNWWLNVKHPKASTPNWDLISTCSIAGERGILLVEAKAHFAELINESHGKSLKTNASSDSISNHARIKLAIEQARKSINLNNPGINISISRNTCYQLSNRIANAWWLANHGIPVVLMYLGFLNCDDMNNGKNILLKTDREWQQCFKTHTQLVGVDQIKDQRVNCGKSKFITICRSN